MGMAVVVVDHDMALVARICDRVTALSAGKVIAEGEPGLVLGSAQFASDYLGSGAANA